MSKVIVIGSQKGGVGKTTTTLNLAYSLCSMGKKVLAIDLDSQANLSTCYGIENTKNLEYTIGHLLMAQIEEEEPEELEHYIQSKDGVDFIPSSIYLSAVEAKLRTEMGAERMLAEVLVPIRDRYDYVLVDTAPSLGMLTVNALAAADEVVITVNPQLLAMMGLQDFLRTVGKIKRRINPKLTIAGILLTMCDGRTTLCKVLTEEVTVSFQGQIKIFKNRIPSTVKVGESIYYSMPIALYSKKAFKDMVDRGALYTKVALQLAFLPEEEQDMVFRVMNEEKTKITSEMVANLRSHSGSLTEAKIKRYLSKNPIKKKCYKVPARIVEKYFEGMDPNTVDSIVEQALAAWFGKENADV